MGSTGADAILQPPFLKDISIMNQPASARISEAIAPLRAQIVQHPVYAAIQDLEDLRIFMQYHIYAVWDFMSLLKALQNALTCTAVPWFPKGSGTTRHLINEIVVGEESDTNAAGEWKSHFEMYLEAMAQCGADAAQMRTFLHELQQTSDFETAYQAAGTPPEARAFVDFTFDVIHSGKAYLQAAIFTFGREDLIPDMFLSLVNDIHRSFPESVSQLKYYLERHIEVDGDHHSHLALQMTADLCGTDATAWEEAERATLQCLQKRIGLWDGAYREIKARRPISA